MAASLVLTWRSLAGMVAGLAMASCVPLAVPPARVEAGFGPYVATRGEATEVRAGRSVAEAPRAAPLSGYGVLRASGGLHLASLMPSPTFPVDVGGGYVLNYFPGSEGRAVHGVYGEVMPVVLRGHRWRALAGVRGELLFAGQPREDEGYGVFGRASLEAFRSVSGSGINRSVGGAAYGTLGAGTYVEVGVQRLPGGDRTTLGVVGLQVRMPAIAMLICCAKL